MFYNLNYKWIGSKICLKTPFKKMRTEIKHEPQIIVNKIIQKHKLEIEVLEMNQLFITIKI